MQSPPIPRILAAVLALLALAGVFLALLAPWGGYEAQGQFSSSGCSGDIAVSDYHLRHLTRTLRSSDAGADDCPTTIIVRFGELASDPSQVTQQRNPGAGELAQAFPLVVTGAGLAVVALALGAFAMERGAPWGFIAAGCAFLALLGILGGTVLYQLGATEQLEWERTAPQGDLRADANAWSWGLGFFGAYGAVVLLLASAVLGFLPDRRPRKEAHAATPAAPSPPDAADRDGTEHAADNGAAQGAATGADPDAHADGPLAPRVPVGASGETAAAGAREGAPARAQDRAGARSEAQAEAPPEGHAGAPRRLKCPECEHRFVGAWGARPVCPACGFSKT